MNPKQAVVPRGEHFVALAVVRSLGKRNIRTTVISEDDRAIAFSSKYCSLVLHPYQTPDCYQAFTENDLIMPTEENSMIELAKNRNRYACVPAFADWRVLEFAFDKKKVLDRAEELRIPCPRSFAPGDLDALEQKDGSLPFQLAIKPVRSLGGLGISFTDSGEKLREILGETEKKFGPVLIQERVPYEERYSVAVLMNFSQSVRRCCVLRALRCYPLNTGPASFVESVARPDLLAMAETLLSSMQFSGVAEVEFVIDSRTNSPKLMEVNPRFWGSLQGAISAGVDFPALTYELFCDGDVPKDPGYRKGIRTRNVIPYEYHRLMSILRGSHSAGVKVSSVLEFLNLAGDDAYFIFSITDPGPFLSIFTRSFRIRFRKLKG